LEGELSITIESAVLTREFNSWYSKSAWIASREDL